MNDEKRKCGFATMSPEKRREISSKGGVAAHANGKAHQFTVEEARENGRKGGIVSAKRRAAKKAENGQ